MTEMQELSEGNDVRALRARVVNQRKALKELGLSDRTYRALYYQEAKQREAAQARILTLERERDEARAIAKRISTALVDLTPGGSEYYTYSKTLDAYFADTEACTRIVRDRFSSGHRAKLERVDESRRALAAETQVQVLREALGAHVADFEERIAIGRQVDTAEIEIIARTHAALRSEP